MMVFMPLVAVLIGRICRDVIGRQNLNIAMIGRQDLEGKASYLTMSI